MVVFWEFMVRDSATFALQRGDVNTVQVNVSGGAGVVDLYARLERPADTRDHVVRGPDTHNDQ
jgi:hypothetical protein